MVWAPGLTQRPDLRPVWNTPIVLCLKWKWDRKLIVKIKVCASRRWALRGAGCATHREENGFPVQPQQTQRGFSSRTIVDYWLGKGDSGNCWCLIYKEEVVSESEKTNKQKQQSMLRVGLSWMILPGSHCSTLCQCPGILVSEAVSSFRPNQFGQL